MFGERSQKRHALPHHRRGRDLCMRRPGTNRHKAAVLRVDIHRQNRSDFHEAHRQRAACPQIEDGLLSAGDEYPAPGERTKNSASPALPNSGRRSHARSLPSLTEAISQARRQWPRRYIHTGAATNIALEAFVDDGLVWCSMPTASKTVGPPRKDAPLESRQFLCSCRSDYRGRRDRTRCIGQPLRAVNVGLAIASPMPKTIASSTKPVAV